MKKIILLLALVGFVSFSSCDKDDPTPRVSRTVRYEITGNYTGNLSATYITASGGGTSESITSLPWTKDITYAGSVPSASLAAAGAGGTSGQIITLKVTAGGTEQSSTPATATTTGQISVSSPSVIF